MPTAFFTAFKAKTKNDLMNNIMKCYHGRWWAFERMSIEETA